MVNVTHLVVISVVGFCDHFRASVTDSVCILCVQWEYYFTDHTGTLCLSCAVSALSPTIILYIHVHDIVLDVLMYNYSPT